MAQLAHTLALFCWVFLALGCTPEPPGQHAPLTSGQFSGLGSYLLPAGASPPQSRRLVYLPVYSRVLFADNQGWELAVTVSIRNTDRDRSIVVERVDYYDSAGALLQTYLDAPHELGPMASTSLTLPQRDRRGGAGANFLIELGVEGSAEPIVEAVMAGVSGTQSFSFSTVGKTLN